MNAFEYFLDEYSGHNGQCFHGDEGSSQDGFWVQMCGWGLKNNNIHIL